MNDEFAEYVKDASVLYKENAPEWRLGQAYWNQLALCQPYLARLVSGTEFDPFHSDDPEKVGKFLEWVQVNWEGKS